VPLLHQDTVVASFCLGWKDVFSAQVVYNKARWYNYLATSTHRRMRAHTHSLTRMRAHTHSLTRAYKHAHTNTFATYLYLRRERHTL